MILIPLVIISPIITNLFGDLFFGEKIMAMMESVYGFNLKNFSLLQRVGLTAISSISSALMAYGLYLGIGITRLFGKGEAFTMPTALLFSRLSKLSLWWGLYDLAQTIGFTLVLMPKMPKNIFVYSLVFLAVIHLFIFILFSAVAALISRGSKLQNDQDLTV